MQKLFILSFCCIVFYGCVNSEKYPSNWTPTPYHIPVTCCMDATQVQGAIRTALIKRDWTVLDVQDNKVYARLSCFGTDADVIFTSTDKYYDINFENIMEEEYNNHDCVYEYTDKLNNLIGKYLKKISNRNAKLEMKAAKLAAKQTQ